MSDQPRPSCQATTASGDPCRGRARHGSRWCPFHDPTLATVRAEGAASGGRNRAIGRRLASGMPAQVSHLADELGQVFAEVRTGQLAPARAHACAAVARAILAAHEATELEQRLGRIERHLTAADAAGPLALVGR